MNVAMGVQTEAKLQGRMCRFRFNLLLKGVPFDGVCLARLYTRPGRLWHLGIFSACCVCRSKPAVHALHLYPNLDALIYTVAHTPSVARVACVNLSMEAYQCGQGDLLFVTATTTRRDTSLQ